MSDYCDRCGADGSDDEPCICGDLCNICNGTGVVYCDCHPMEACSCHPTTCVECGGDGLS
jgi:hypothetical protein